MRYEGPDDKQLLALIVEQDRGPLEAFYDRYAGAVFSLAVKMLREQGAAEEVTQDTFFNVWRRASSYKSGRGSVTAWLFSIAHHRTIDELRRRRRESTRVQFGVDLRTSHRTVAMTRSHLEACEACPLNLQVEGETRVRLAFAVPQRQVPPAVKLRLLSRIDTGTPAVSLSGLSRAASSFWRAFAPHTAKAVTSFMVVGLIVSGIWFNSRLNDISSSNEELIGEMESVAEAEAEVRGMIASQRYLSFVTDAPGVSVNVLRGTERAADA